VSKNERKIGMERDDVPSCCHYTHKCKMVGIRFLQRQVIVGTIGTMCGLVLCA
jgi:hypothetical protein